MLLKARLACGLAPILLVCGCSGPATTRAAPPVLNERSTELPAEIHLSGTTRAVHFFNVQVPQISSSQGGQGGRLMLIKLIANGSKVQPGDVLAQFDPTDQLDSARDIQAKYDDLSHQVDQREAQNRSDAARRRAALAQAEADLTKSGMELKKGPLLSEIDRLKNEVRAEDARVQVESLTKSNLLHDRADAAALRILELQRDRQKVALERAQNNLNKLTIRAPIAGMVAQENIFRNNSFGHPQEGDQLFGGQPLVKIFDPAQMAVRVTVGEPEGAALVAGTRANVQLDAYPNLLFPAHFESANPAASAALGTPVKSFNALFVLEKTDAHVLPDMAAAVILKKGEAAP
jgi:HlyD family secretion protein